MAKPLGNSRETSGFGRVALENIGSDVGPQQAKFNIAIGNIARCSCRLKVVKPEFAVGMIGVLPGLGGEVSVMDQPGGVVIVVKNIPMGVEGANLEGMVGQKGWAHAGEVGIGIEPLLDFVVVGFQVKAGFGAVDQHDAEAPEVRGVMVVSGRFGQEVVVVEGGIEEFANIRQTDRIGVSPDGFALVVADLGNKEAIEAKFSEILIFQPQGEGGKNGLLIVKFNSIMRAVEDIDI